MTLAVDKVVQQLNEILAAPLAAAEPLPGVIAQVTTPDETVYAGAAGKRSFGGDSPLTADSVLTIFSATKAVATVAILQLAESGVLDLDAPARRYAPELGDIKVLAGFTDEGAPVLREPKRHITTRMLILHTAGFGYPNFNPDYQRLLRDGVIASPGDATFAALRAPLLFDPGERWEYGIGLDWAGVIAERAASVRFDQLLHDRVLLPLGMNSTAFVITDDMRARLAPVHTRLPDGGIMALDYMLPQEPEIYMAGQALYSTVPDYMNFIRMWLSNGRAADGSRILMPETVEAASRNGLGPLKVPQLPGIDRFMNLDIDFFPAISKSWALAGMVNDGKLPTGRPAGSLSWVGLANSYFWIDRVNRIGGFWASNTLPLGDPASLEAYLAFETAVYNTLLPAVP
jgi:methyl acetate hydrolase